MRRIQSKLRLIERVLEGLYNPRVAKEDFEKNGRSILQNSKTKEIKNLVEKVYETQKLIDELDDPTAHYVMQDELNKLEFRRQQLICPSLCIECET